MAAKKRGLGKGLSALLEDSQTDITTRKAGKGGTEVLGSVSELPIKSIETNPFQPRTHFEKEALKDLTDSIKAHGIIQPVTVRKMGRDQYQLISGERRFRAAQLAELKVIPCFIRVADDQSMLEMALVENIQREELDAVEVAISFQRLIDECSLTQEQLSERMGKKRSTVTNYLRLLKLPAEIQLAIRDRKISMGHARALINIEDGKKQIQLFRKAVDESLSVRQVEELVRNQAKPNQTKPRRSTNALSFQASKLRDDLRTQFGEKVSVTSDENGKGKVVIPFDSEADLDKIAAYFDI